MQRYDGGILVCPISACSNLKTSLEMESAAQSRISVLDSGLRIVGCRYVSMFCTIQESSLFRLRRTQISKSVLNWKVQCKVESPSLAARFVSWTADSFVRNIRYVNLRWSTSVCSDCKPAWNRKVQCNGSNVGVA